MINYNQDLKIFFSDKINDGGYFSGFGTRQLGDGRKNQNIENFLLLNNIFYNKLVTLEQIHSANVCLFHKTIDQKIERIEDTDGIITSDSNTFLSVRTADCLPVIFLDKKAGLIGIAHIGWRGSMKRLVQKMIDQIIINGATKENIIVAIGPGIGSCCYSIPDNRYYQFLEEFDGYSEKIFRFSTGKRYVNLIKLNYLLLLEKEIKKENIDYFPFCTCCDINRFFSFRRDKKEEFGEMFHFIIKKEEQELFSI